MDRRYSPGTKARRHQERQDEAARRKESLISLQEIVGAGEEELRVLVRLDKLVVCWYRGYCGDRWDAHRLLHVGPASAPGDGTENLHKQGNR